MVHNNRMMSFLWASNGLYFILYSFGISRLDPKEMDHDDITFNIILTKTLAFFYINRSFHPTFVLQVLENWIIGAPGPVSLDPYLLFFICWTLSLSLVEDMWNTFICSNVSILFFLEEKSFNLCFF